MNYYKRHIGDYAAKAGHLSPLEHGVYGLLIDAYYNREEAPTKAEAIRWARARSADELAALDTVLAEFFAEADGRFVQTRVEEELAAFHVKQEANRALGQKGGQAKAKRLASETLSEPLSEQVACRLANGGPSHKPLATSQKESKAEAPKTADAVSAEAVVAAYHEALPDCRRVVALTPKRLRTIANAQRNAKALCKQRGWDYGADFWRDYFAECAKDPWYRGETVYAANPGWKQSLDVILRDEHFAKIMDRALEAAP